MRILSKDAQEADAPASPPVAEPVTDDTPTVDGMARRCAMLARSLLSWDDARMALLQGMGLLRQWERTQPHPHNPDADDK